MEKNYFSGNDNLLPIGGITPFSTLDYPDKLSSVFFFQGCHLNCGYCHNPQFKIKKKTEYYFSQFIEFLNERKNLIDAIVFSGGEPFLHYESLKKLAEHAVNKGFFVGIHTTGSFPELLEDLVKSVKISWIGVDLKAPKEHYQTITNSKINYFNKTVKSIKILTKHKINFEARTTINNELNKNKNLNKLVELYSNLGIKKPVFQTLAKNGKQNLKIKNNLEQFAKEKSILIR